MQVSFRLNCTDFLPPCNFVCCKVDFGILFSKAWWDLHTTLTGEGNYLNVLWIVLEMCCQIALGRVRQLNIQFSIHTELRTIHNICNWKNYICYHVYLCIWHNKNSFTSKTKTFHGLQLFYRVKIYYNGKISVGH
jgi:hypothetical protein